MLKGIILILFAELLLTSSQAIAKYITGISHIRGDEISFFRFALGLIVMIIFIYYRSHSIIPNKIKYIVMRGISNSFGLILLFISLQYTTVSNATILNMTYPVFVFFISPFITREPTKRIYALFLITAVTGAYLIVVPDFSHINIGDIIALSSAIMGGIGIPCLRQASKHDDPYLILFYMMLIGATINGALIIPTFTIPQSTMLWFFILVSAALGFIGQILITIAYKYVDAPSGSLTSSCRVIYAIAIGVLLFSDPLNARILTGCILIVLSLVVMSGFFERFKPHFRKIRYLLGFGTSK